MEKTYLKSVETLFLYFMMAAIIGWCYEVFLEVVVYQWGFRNRGVLFGPYCPIYGFGLLAFLLCFKKIMQKKLRWSIRWLRPIVILIGCGAVATLIELIASYILEWTTGAWPWQTYADYAIHFQARIALSPSIRFGIGGVLFLYLLYPLFTKLTDHMSPRCLHWTTTILLIILIIDFTATLLYHLFG